MNDVVKINININTKGNEKFSSNSLKDHVSSDARTLKARGHRREERLLKNDALN